MFALWFIIMLIQSQSRKCKIGKLRRLYCRRLDKNVAIASVWPGQVNNKTNLKFLKPDGQRLGITVD